MIKILDKANRAFKAIYELKNNKSVAEKYKKTGRVLELSDVRESCGVLELSDAVNCYPFFFEFNAKFDKNGCFRGVFGAFFFIFNAKKQKIKFFFAGYSDKEHDCAAS